MVVATTRQKDCGQSRPNKGVVTNLSECNDDDGECEDNVDQRWTW